MDEKNNLKILALDDQQDYLAVLRKALGRLLPGAAVLTAACGQKGIALALAEAPDVILLDIAMPGMNGFEVCRALKADGRLKNIPVAFMTAVRPDRETAARAAEAGAEGFLTKPFEAEELAVQVRALANCRVARTAQAGENSRLETLVADGTLALEKERTGRRLVEESLRMNEALYRALFAHARDSILLLELPPDGLPVIADANDAALLLHGYAREELLGRPISFLDAEASVPLVRERVARIRAAGGAAFEARHRRKDGSVFELEVSVREVEVGGRRFLFDISRDLSGRRRAEREREKLREQFLQAQKMEAIGQLAGGVAHDFNNLLTAIMGYAEFLRAAIPAGNPKAGDVEEIMKAGERAAQLTGQLLTFCRKQAVQFKVLDLDRIVPGMAKMLRRMIPENIAIRTSLNSGGAAVLANQGQLEQVLMNLAVNARDAMPDGGELSFETAQAELDADSAAGHPGVSPGRYVMVTVSDTGRGMSPEVAARIFEPFFTTKERGKGTGLGLSTVYGIVRQSGGHISVRSEPGGGAAFQIYLPAAAGTTGPQPAEKPAPSSYRGTETILLVEDDEAVRKVASRLLSQNGYTVLEAAAPREALRLCEARKDISLMITDIIMPQMNGYELSRVTTALAPRMKVIFMSGYTDNALPREELSGSGTVFLEKPLEAETVLRRIREVLDGGRADAGPAPSESADLNKT